MGSRMCEHLRSKVFQVQSFGRGGSEPKAAAKVLATWKGGWDLNDHGSFHDSYDVKRTDSKREVCAINCDCISIS